MKFRDRASRRRQAAKAAKAKEAAKGPPVTNESGLLTNENRVLILRSILRHRKAKARQRAAATVPDATPDAALPDATPAADDARPPGTDTAG